MVAEHLVDISLCDMCLPLKIPFEDQANLALYLMMLKPVRSLEYAGGGIFVTVPIKKVPSKVASVKIL